MHRQLGTCWYVFGLLEVVVWGWTWGEGGEGEMLHTLQWIAFPLDTTQLAVSIQDKSSSPWTSTPAAEPSAACKDAK